jgi:pimeloyl-ACP methyl ester carboxylesterase
MEFTRMFSASRGAGLALALCILATGTTRTLAADDGPPAKKVAAGDLKGNWLGTITAGGSKLRLGFAIEKTQRDELSAKLFSIDQKNAEFAVDAVEWKGNKISLIVNQVGGSFVGTLDPQSGEITGEWKQGSQALPIILKKVDVLPIVKRPQVPQKPYPYLEEEVSFKNAKHNVTLNGTLTLPRGKGPFPAVVLISGSGPQNRNEELLDHRPFLVLADAVTRRGIAVLRFDDRDFGKPAETFKATSVELSEDTLAGVTFLRSRSEIAAAKIGLVGHSEGGLIAPMLAAKEKDIAFIVMIAGPGLPGDAILRLQGERLKKNAGLDEATLEKDRVTSRQMYDIVKSEPDDDAAMKKIEALFQDLITKGDAKTDEVGKAALDGEVKILLTPWFRSYIAYDPKPALTKVTCPVLAVIGERDFQVPARENLPVIEAALKEGGNRDFLVKELPGLNHLLQPCETGMLDEYATIEVTIDPSALKLIGDWIVQRTK